MKPHAHEPRRSDSDGREHVGDLVPPIGDDGVDDHVSQLIASAEEEDLDPDGAGDEFAAPEVAALHIVTGDEADDLID